MGANTLQGFCPALSLVAAEWKMEMFNLQAGNINAIGVNKLFNKRKIIPESTSWKYKFLTENCE